MYVILVNPPQKHNNGVKIMPRTKDATRTASKWGRVTSQSGESYAEGVQNPRTSWKEATAASGARWGEGVQAAITNKRFDKGVAKSSNEAWSSGAIQKGVPRFGAGVAVAQEKYSAAIAPYLATISATDIGPKYAKGDPRNIERVRKLALALHAKKLA
jgi:hypothetical protein